MTEKETHSESKEHFGAPMLQLENLGFDTYDRVLFQDLNLIARENEVVAVTGKSGSGKTVLLKIIAGLEHPEEGTVQRASSASIHYVPQELDDADIDVNIPIGSFFKKEKGLLELEDKISGYEQQMADNPSIYDEIADDYMKTVEEYQERDGYRAEADIKRILTGLSLDEQSEENITFDTTLAEVSSGQLRKLLIGRGLYSEASILLLDDPTSHLDVNAINWLADYLKQCKSAVVLATNEEAFIDRCVNQTLGLTDLGRVFSFSGGYSEFVQKRDEIVQAEISAANTVASKIDQLEKTDQMFRSKQAYKRSADMAQVGRALASRMDRLRTEFENMPGSQQVYNNDKTRNLAYQERQRSGNDVIQIDRPVIKYGDYTAVDLSSNEPIQISRGEKWLVWGPNGSGKSTLFRLVANIFDNSTTKPNQGSISVGANIELGYYASDEVHVGKTGTVVEEVERTFPDLNKGHIVSALQYFGFNVRAVHHQRAATLSSGEKKRLALAKLMLKKPNLILLDEPTGGFMPEDIKTRFANAINGFEGTAVIISHDEEFISQLKLDRKLDMPEGKVSIVDQK